NPIVPAAGGAQLVEGGGGYRHNVARGDFDCLMRRIATNIRPVPPNAAQLPIQADVDFCEVCRRVLRWTLNGDPEFDLSGATRVLLRSQRVEFDATSWPSRTGTGIVALGSLPFRQHVEDEPTIYGPKWSFELEVN